MGKRLIAEQVVENGAPRGWDSMATPEPIALPVVRKWYVQVQSLPSGRLQGSPFVFATQSEASDAIAQLEAEHRAMGWADRYDVVCWAE